MPSDRLDTRVWLYGPNGEAEIFASPADAPPGWADTPAAFKKKPDAPEKVSETLEILRERAKSLGVEVDGRWKVARLKAEIEKHGDGA